MSEKWQELLDLTRVMAGAAIALPFAYLRDTIMHHTIKYGEQK